MTLAYVQAYPSIARFEAERTRARLAYSHHGGWGQVSYGGAWRLGASRTDLRPGSPPDVGLGYRYRGFLAGYAVDIEQLRVGDGAAAPEFVEGRRCRWGSRRGFT